MQRQIWFISNVAIWSQEVQVYYWWDASGCQDTAAGQIHAAVDLPICTWRKEGLKDETYL